MKIAITGASGLIGRPLSAALQSDGHSVIRLVRGSPSSPDERPWDPAHARLDPEAIADTDAVVHLAGAGVADHRWTPSYRSTIRDSRVNGTAAVAQAMATAQGPRILLSGSAIGFYGDTGDRLTDESGPAGTGFLAEVCRAWEAATEPAQAAGVRVAHLRTGVVLTGSGGALGQQVRIFKLGLGAPLGTGRQWLSWISLQDEIAAIRHLLTAEVARPVNLVAPAPVTNREFTKTLGRVLHRPTLPVPVPGLALKLALGGFAEEGVLQGQRLAPDVLTGSGFQWAHPALEPALRASL